MIRAIRKYLVPFLSAALILSNFSFAVSYMMCRMDDSGKMSCKCSAEPVQKTDGVSIMKHVSSCCEQGKIELANTNVLQQGKVENHNNPLQVLCTIHQNMSDMCLVSSSNLNIQYIHTYLPVSDRDIYVLTSSLLI